MTSNPKQSDTSSRKGTFGKIAGAAVLFACVVGLGYLLYQQKAQAQDELAPGAYYLERVEAGGQRVYGQRAVY